MTEKPEVTSEASSRFSVLGSPGAIAFYAFAIVLLLWGTKTSLILLAAETLVGIFFFPTRAPWRWIRVPLSYLWRAVLDAFKDEHKEKPAPPRRGQERGTVEEAQRVMDEIARKRQKDSGR